MFEIQDLVSPIGYFGNHRWTVDEPEDFEVVKKIYEHFLADDPEAWFGYKDILSFLDENPDIRDINKMYTRNEGLAKSIREDPIIPEE